MRHIHVLQTNAELYRETGRVPRGRPKISDFRERARAVLSLCDSSQNPLLAVRRELSWAGEGPDLHGHAVCSGVNSSRPITGKVEGIKFACGGCAGLDGEASGLFGRHSLP